MDEDRVNGAIMKTDADGNVEAHTRENGKMANSTAREPPNGLVMAHIIKHTKESGKMANSTVRERSNILVVTRTRESGKMT